MSESEFTHFDEAGSAQMVDISSKPATEREAIASCQVRMSELTKEKIIRQQFAKGDVFAVAQIAGIMAAKRTSELIPLCHPLPLTKVKVEFEWDPSEEPAEMAYLVITAIVKVNHQTGVEMEALTACSVAALTVYDMCKSVEKGIVIDGLRLVQKSGGKSGLYQSTDVLSQHP